MSKKSKFIYLSLSTLFFIILNRFFSDFIIQNGRSVPENPLLQITYIENTGAAFNIFEGYKIFLIAFAALAILGILFYTVKHIQKAPVIGLLFVAVLISGIFNNMLERITYGHVIDFIKLNFVDFPVFNLSDAFINIGVIGIVCLILKNSCLKK